jgi:hypothetical protein
MKTGHTKAIQKQNAHPRVDQLVRISQHAS